ncbi:uncharacterized protein [Dermacentor andersoni]|uniref:uncharacterized protein isoform X2 n=1 Tax=Dermacentor andersoni TaxID=34620 RepID=UPI002418000B|nr:uncharacterized protein LOC126534033 isoform X2 [Dermacentor andersoni]
MISRKKMRELSLFFTFFLLLPAAVRLRGDLGTLRERRGAKIDIKDFFNTSEPMWTFLSSEKVTVDCKVEVVKSITDTYVSFQSSFIVKNFRANLTILGTFKMMDAEKNNNKFDTVLLSNPGRQPYGYERLLFQTPDNKCGVFLVAIYGSKSGSDGAHHASVPIVPLPLRRR